MRNSKVYFLVEFGLLEEHIAYSICVFCKSKTNYFPFLGNQTIFTLTANICAGFGTEKKLVIKLD